MAQQFFSIDGHIYNVGVTGLKRSAQILDGENAGRVKSGSMIRDVIGTYYNYVVTIATNELSPSDYDNLYELVTAPVDSHDMVLPYGASGTLSFKAYITSAEDELEREKHGTDNNKNRWGNLTLTFTAMSPKRRP